VCKFVLLLLLLLFVPPRSELLSITSIFPPTADRQLPKPGMTASLIQHPISTASSNALVALQKAAERST
jgi:hypothetical protein